MVRNFRPITIQIKIIIKMNSSFDRWLSELWAISGQTPSTVQVPPQAGPGGKGLAWGALAPQSVEVFYAYYCPPSDGEGRPQ